LKEQAAQLLAQVEESGVSEAHRFLDWYARKFEISVAANSE